MRVASMATFADRIDIVHETVNSLLPQVDKVVVYFNPPFPLDDELIELTKRFDAAPPNIEVVLMPEDLKDLSKFAAIWDYPEATIFTCDDDLIYSPDYCEKMEQYLHYGSPVFSTDLVSAGGKVLKEPPFTTYKDAISLTVSCLADKFKMDNLSHSDSIDVPLTGCSVFSAARYQEAKIDKRYIGMADIQMFAWNTQLNLKARKCMNYSGYMMHYNPKMGKRSTIWSEITTKETKLIGKYLNEILCN